MFPLFELWSNPARFEPGLGGGVALCSGCPLTTPVGAGERLCDVNCPEPFLWCPSSFTWFISCAPSVSVLRIEQVGRHGIRPS